MRYFFSIVTGFFLLINITIVEFATAQVTNTASNNTTTSAVTLPIALPNNPDDIGDDQLRQFIQKAKAAGISDQQIRQAALAKGMQPSDVDKLQTRINLIRTPKDVAQADQNKTRLVIGDNNKKDDENQNTTSEKDKINSEPSIFGSEYFNNSNLTFEPNLRIPTPADYKLGPDDQLVINIYGNSIADWKLTVSPDGSIALPGIGPVNVSGKTIDQATSLITSKLVANRYAIGHGTNVAITLGNIKSIKVTLIGEIVKPGTYVFSGFTTVFNALYLSGGPSNNGSFRKIEVIRNNEVIRKLDFYDFLLTGTQKDNIRLQDGDVIRVPTYDVHVTLVGQVKRPAIFEVLPGESLSDVIRFAGGFTDVAYKSTIKVTQVTDRDLRVTDVKAADISNYVPLRGDYYTVGRILDTYENRVSILGAVVRPGQFELDKGLTLTQLISKAAGLRQDAFTSRDFITRLKADNTSELISFDAKAILDKTAPDILLKREDVITIPSIFDLHDEYIVTINGDVRGQGDFPFVEKMSVEDLVVQAGGFAEGASPNRIVISRRINNSDPSKINSAVSQVFSIDIDSQFKLNASSFILQPYDVVSVYSLPGFEKQRIVRIEGEVLYPGNYTITTNDEKVSDLVKRAGGLTAMADIDGGRLKRVDNMGADSIKGKTDINEVNQERADRLAHIQKTLNDSTTNVFEQLRNNYVGIDLRKILANPNSNIDITLEEGDVLRIPKVQQLVKINGEVLFPSSVVYDSSKSFADFVNGAGGFSPNALRHRAYVIYANGSVKSTRSFLFIKSYPEIKPGSEIVIPKRPVRKGVSVLELGAIAGTLASAAAVLIGIITLTR